MSTDAPAVARPRWPWAVLLALYLLLALIFSVIQPLGRTPDESAHVTYVKYLAENLQLPIWAPRGGGEAGYEAQHPPLYYGIMAVVYRLASPLAEEWRWQLMRWFTIVLVGVPMFVICRRFFTELWGEQGWHPLIACATVMLMPMFLLYTGYINPDAMAMLWTTLALWLAWRTHTGRGEGGLKQAALLGLVAGLAALSKISGAPALVLALLAWVQAGPKSAEGETEGRAGYRVAWPQAGLTLLVFALTCGWWYARNVFLYSTPFIHTEGMMGSGLQVASRFGFGGFAWLTLKETYLSSWVQRGWFPSGFWTILLYGVIMVATVAAAAGLVKGKRRGEGPAEARPLREKRRESGPDSIRPLREKRRESGPDDIRPLREKRRGDGPDDIRPVREKRRGDGPDDIRPLREQRRGDGPGDIRPLPGTRAAERVALNFSGLLLVLLFLGHQWAYWTVDVEFNAGGRYILVGMAGLALLLVSGLRKLLGERALPVLAAWLVSLLVMNQVSIWCIWTLLNPRYAPGWKIFHFPV